MRYIKNIFIVFIMITLKNFKVCFIEHTVLYFSCLHCRIRTAGKCCDNMSNPFNRRELTCTFYLEYVPSTVSILAHVG